MSLIMALSLASVAGPLVGPAAAASQNDAWGVTGVNFTGSGDYSEVFKVDPATGTVTIVGAYTGGSTYSDIAMTPNGNLYTVGWDADGITGTTGNFFDFYRLNPTTGAVIGSWLNLFPNNGLRQVNALCAESNTTLLAMEGGGINNPHLIRINLTGSGNFQSLTDLGALPTGPSGGDLDRDPFTGKWYGAFEGTGQTEIWELNIINPSASTLASAHSVTYLAGLSFRPNGTSTGVLLASSWNNRNLYEVNVTASTTTLLWDLSSSLTGNIFGLSPIQAESVSNPGTPTGPSSGNVGQSLTFSTGGATSNLGHTVEYRFDWDDGSYSPWSTSASASNSWSVAGTYSVKAQARCATHTGILSGWSAGKSVTIGTATPTPTPSGGSGNCFIATASYGPDDSNVATLRAFRDDYMRTNPVGQGLVSTYYKISPPIAGFIDNHPALKPIVRLALLPAVSISTLAMNTGWTEKIAIVCLAIIVSTVAFVRLRKKTAIGNI